MRFEEDAYDAPVSEVSARGLLFTDIEGSSALLRTLGGRYEGVLSRHHELVRGAVGRHSGTEVGREGDSLFITFPSATAALEGAVEAQLSIERARWPSDGRGRVRLGVHVGEVADTRVGLVGLAIHAAARVMNTAHGGQIVASAEVVQQAAGLPAHVTARSLGTFELRDVGRVSLRQLEHPELQLRFPPLRTRHAVAHNLPATMTALVGRDAEASAVAALLDEHRLVTLVGEGGCGKTRLALRVAEGGLGRFVDGVWFVDLAPLSATADAAVRVARALGLDGGPLRPRRRRTHHHRTTRSPQAPPPGYDPLEEIQRRWPTPASDRSTT